MKIALYGRQFSNNSLPFIQEVIDNLVRHGVEILIYEDFRKFIESKKINISNAESFTDHTELTGHVKCMLSLGGDGTLLDTLSLVRDSGLPVLGINLGRLGFLASINKTEIKNAIDSLVREEYTLDKRVLITLDSSDADLFGEVNYALNEITIHKQDASPMIIIHTYINGEFLNSYWADGLIISTPTGSTAYSLSCGGPIVFPQSGNFVITPICPHNLSVRPIVISDSSVLTFKIEARATQFLVSMDSRTEKVDTNVVLTAKKESFSINLIRLYNESYLTTLRNKLMWGLDSRN
ncbi:NAD kinase [Solitalea sp. MAHUQ-68]|uniref:NAD kinase n=1 Tax=Solitalea agri TaxID=2953739 RepID=A0A9X2F6C2_9SPHI|nr:NAD kinase [Solitalea agri]MCO4293206.1 NAD kinase [Solitalea agri]